MKHDNVKPKPRMYIDFNKENNKKGLKFKVVIMLEYLNTKIFLQNLMFQFDPKKTLWF